MTKEHLITTATVILTGFLGWVALTLLTVDKRTAVIDERVNANYRMLQPMWEDYVRKSEARHDNEQGINAPSSKSASTEKEVFAKAQTCKEDISSCLKTLVIVK